MTQETLKLALDFIENGNLGEWRGVTERRKEIITALKEALAKEKALQALHSENERLGLYKDAYKKLTWVGLTDEQIWQIATDSTIGGDLHADKFARAIEAKLKERNDHSL